MISQGELSLFLPTIGFSNSYVAPHLFVNPTNTERYRLTDHGLRLERRPKPHPKARRYWDLIESGYYKNLSVKDGKLCGMSPEGMRKGHRV